jgi:AcrR family transcriptional regulator
LYRKTKLVQMTYLVLSKEEQLKDEAIQAAQKLFQQYGFHKTTMEDIAKAMGRGKSTLYYYYKSKDEIFLAVIMQEIEDVFKTTKKAIEKVNNAEEKLKVYFSTSLKTIKSKAFLYKILKGEILDNLSQVNILVKKFNTKEVLSIKEILLMGINNNEFTDSLREDIDLLAYSTVSALRSLAVDLIIEEKFPNWDERLDVLISIILKGIKK